MEDTILALLSFICPRRGDHGNADSDMSRIRRAGAWDSSWRETSPRAAELHDGRVAEIFLEGDNNQ